MGYALTLVNGVARMTSITGAGSITIKEEGTVIEANAAVLNFVGSSVTAVSVSPGNVDVQVNAVTPTPAIYDETYTAGSTITTGTPVTLPNSGSYTSDELEVFLSGQRLSYGLDYSYVSVPPRTQVAFTFDLVNGDLVRFRKDRNFSDSPSIYDTSLLVVSGAPSAGEINVTDVQSGDNITLPSGKTFDSGELEVWLNGQRLDDMLDYNYVGTVPRTQISLTFDLAVGDVLRFRIDRPA